MGFGAQATVGAQPGAGCDCNRRLKTLYRAYKPQIFLSLLTAGALLVEGYHPFAEDAEIYLPGVEKILHPELFPLGREFFLAHARLTLFPNAVALFLRLTHLPLETGLCLWHLASIYLLLLACWELSGVFRWRGSSS